MAQSNEPVPSSKNSADFGELSRVATTPQRDGGTSAAPPASSCKLTQTALILGALVLIVGGVLLLLQLFVARRLPEMTEARFEAAQALWEKSGPVSYDMNVRITGAQPGLVNIEVRDGNPTAMTRDDIAPPERTWDTWAVPGMFQTLVEEFAFREDPTHKGQGAPGAEVWLRCEFDPQYGYPRTYQRLMTGGGPQVEWHVTKFEPK
jgi:hypothetical protein